MGIPFLMGMKYCSKYNYPILYLIKTEYFALLITLTTMQLLKIFLQ